MSKEAEKKTFNNSDTASGSSSTDQQGGLDPDMASTDNGRQIDHPDHGTQNETKGDSGAKTDLENEILSLRTELDETRGRMLRALADVENVNRSSNQRRIDAEKYGGSALANDLLPVYDSMQRALDLVSDELRKASPNFFEGIDLTMRELIRAFEKNKISQIQAKDGDKFDPNLHQIISEIPSEDFTPGSIVQVMQEGFKIHDRLLRPAYVGIAKAVEKNNPEKKDL